MITQQFGVTQFGTCCHFVSFLIYVFGKKMLLYLNKIKFLKESTKMPNAVLRVLKNPRIIALFICVVTVIIVVAVVLSKKNKKSSFGKSNVIELYHAKWCHYCTEFVPNVFDPVTSEFKGLIVKKYEADDDAGIISKVVPSIGGYPTVRMNGEEFTGDRTASNFRDFIKRNIE